MASKSTVVDLNKCNKLNKITFHMIRFWVPEEHDVLERINHALVDLIWGIELIDSSAWTFQSLSFVINDIFSECDLVNIVNILFTFLLVTFIYLLFF